MGIDLLSTPIEQIQATTQDANSVSVMNHQGTAGKPVDQYSAVKNKYGWVGGDGSKISEKYKVKIYSERQQDLVIGLLPEKMNYQVTSEWEPLIPFAPGGDMANTVMQAVFKKSLVTRFTSRRIWKGTSPIEFPLRLVFEYVQGPNAYQNVRGAADSLVNMALPIESGNIGLFGFDSGIKCPLLVPPGPSPFKQDEQGDRIRLWIGNHIFFDNVIIHNVQVETDSRLDKEGYPVRAEVTMTIQTYEIQTKQSMAKAMR